MIERWPIAGLRHRVLHSLAELTAIGAILHRLNDERPIRRLDMTRRQLFDKIDRPVLKALPAAPCVFAQDYQGRAARPKTFPDMRQSQHREPQRKRCQ